MQAAVIFTNTYAAIAFFSSLSDKFIVNNPIKTVPLSPIKKNESNQNKNLSKKTVYETY
jgi:hypothetical protein